MSNEPDLEILFDHSPPFCHKTFWRSHSDKQLNEPVYFFRFRLENKGMLQASNCEAVLEALWVLDESSQPLSVADFAPTKLRYDEIGTRFVDVNPGRRILWNIGHISSVDYQKKVERARFVDVPDKHGDELRFVLEFMEVSHAQPNSLLPGKYVIKVSVYAANAASSDAFFLIEWSGKWQDAEKDMFREIVIRRLENSWPNQLAESVVSNKETSVNHKGSGANSTKKGIPTSFISYSWDDEEHKDWVRDLATRLRRDGVDVKLDQWETTPGDQLPAFMEQSISSNEYVLIICTPYYKKRSEKREGGVGYEGNIMTAELYATGNERKFIPILRHGSWNEALPSWLRGKYGIDLRGNPYPDHSYKDLLTTLHKKRTVAPPLGPVPKVFELTNAWKEKSDLQFSEANGEIRIEGVIVDEVSEPRMDGTKGSALYRIPFLLSRMPSAEWATLFREVWNRPPRFTTMHRPGIATVSGDRIILDGTTIEEVEEYHRDTLVLVVKRVNKIVEEHEAKRHLEEEEKKLNSDKHQKNLEEVSKRLKFEPKQQKQPCNVESVPLYYYDNPPYNSIEMHYVGEEVIKDVRVWKIYIDESGVEQRVQVKQFFPQKDLKMIWYHVPVNVMRKNDVYRFHLIGESHTFDQKATVEVTFTDMQTGGTLRKKQNFELKR